MCDYAMHAYNYVRPYGYARVRSTRTEFSNGDAQLALLHVARCTSGATRCNNYVCALSSLRSIFCPQYIDIFCLRPTPTFLTSSLLVQGGLLYIYLPTPVRSDSEWCGSWDYSSALILNVSLGFTDIGRTFDNSYVRKSIPYSTYRWV